MKDDIWNVRVTGRQKKTLKNVLYSKIVFT